MPAGESPDADWFRLVADGGRLVFFVLRMQPDVAFEFLTDAVEDQLGVPAAEGLADAATVLGTIEPAHAGRLAEALALPAGSDTTVELTWRHREGREVHSRTWARSRQRPDGSVVLEGVTRDITQLRETESELRLSEARYRLLAENAWEVIWTMGLDGTITYVSPAVQRVRGITPQEAMRQSIDEIHPPASAASVSAYYQRLFAAIAGGTEPPVFRGVHEYYRRDGSIMTGELQVIPHVDAGGNVVEILGVTRDVSEAKALEAELTRLAATDPITGVWNRRHCEEALTAAFADARRHGEALSLVMLDIDHFKTINDNYGHQAGDRVLVELARRLQTGLRGTDIVARWGGEEFVVVLRHCSLDDAFAVAEKIRARIAETPFDEVGTVTVSAGVAVLRRDDDLPTWLDRADDGLYDAKRSGRNAVRAG